MANKILVAIDSSGLSEHVVPTLSAQMCPEITEVLVLQVVAPLLHSLPDVCLDYGLGMALERHRVWARAKSTLRNAEEAFRTAGFKVTSRLVEGDIKRWGAQLAAEWRADLIVVSSQTDGEEGKFLHNSVVEGIVHCAPCSVWVLKETEKLAAA